MEDDIKENPEWADYVVRTDPNLMNLDEWSKTGSGCPFLN
jgi:hypothetical protein